MNGDKNPSLRQAGDLSTLAVTGMAPEVPCRSKLAELMSYHGFCHEHRDEVLPVVNSDGFTHHVGYDHGSSGPGLDYLLALALLCRFHLLHQLVMNVRAFFNRTWHK